MHKKSRISKAITASLMAVTMLAPTVATIAPMSASAGQVLGETSFTYKALPWHTCESSPAKQNFELTKDGKLHVMIIKAVGADAEKWDLQVRHRNLSFKEGHSYEVSFKAKAKRSGMELCSKIGDISGNKEYFVLDTDSMHNGPHNSNGGQWASGAAKLTTEFQEFKGTFTPDQDLEACEWCFHYAKGTQWQGNAIDGDEIWFDDMSIVCTTCDDCDSDPDESYGATNRTYAAMTVDKDKYMPGGTINNYISVNQIGYYTNLSKVAVLSDNSGDILTNKQTISLSGTYDFELCDASTDKVVYEGKSGAVIADKDSADNVCKLDFSEYKTPGRYYLKIKDKDWRSFDFNIGDNIYSDSSHDMLTNAMNYFYQNRSGCDIEDKYCTSGGSDGKGTGMGHKGGHTTDTAYVQKIWKKEYAEKSDATSTYASSSITANKGWYDAGDHGKYVVNGGISVWTLQNMYERAIKQPGYDKKFDDNSGTVVIPENGNKIPDVLDECDYELDFMSQMVVKSDEPTWGKYAGMVYHKLHDHKWTGLATKPWDYAGDTLEDGTKGWGTVRIVKPPTFTATLNYAACAAQAARLWAPYDKTKAEKYLDAAVTSFKAYKENFVPYDSELTQHPDLDCQCPKEELNEKSLYAPMWHAKGGGPYGDDNALDDAYWAACEIFVSASEMGKDSTAKEFKGVIDDSEYAYKVGTRMVGGENKDGSFTSFNWGNTASAGSLTLSLHQDLLSASEISTLEGSIVEAADAYIAEEKTQGYGIPYKYDGKGYNDPNNLDPSITIYGYEWGSNSMVINNCIVMAYAYDLTKDIKYMNGVTTGMDYLLGVNPLAFSFITGYGVYTEKKPHHRYWSYELDKTLPMAPDGVLSGGPNSGLQDPYVRALGFVPGEKTNPSQRCFVDSIEAWSTNEVTINWNSPLAWIASFLQDEAADADPNGETETKPEPTEGGDLEVTLWGDADVDGDVTIADVTVVLSAVASGSKAKISPQGRLNADVYQNGDGLNALDATAIQKKLASIITELPESYL